jgi:sugar phosphate isomerase/epimerase
VLDAIGAHGLSRVHFNLKSAGEPSLPDAIDPAVCAAIRHAFEARGFVMTSISATFNSIHPEVRQRELDIGRACNLMLCCGQLGTSVVTLCSGTRDPHDMWKRHADNDRPDAWRDLLTTLSRLLAVAERTGVLLGIEPEHNNVVDSAIKARRLLDELRSPHLRIILDGANLVDRTHLTEMQEVLREAFELLAEDVILVHAKDIADLDQASQAAGKGLLDWPTYFGLLQEYQYDGTVILHNLNESEAAASVSFVRKELDAIS